MFVIEYASEILQLAISFALIALGIWLFVLTATLLKVNKLLKRVNGFINIFEHYIQKPLHFLVGAEKMFSKFLRR